MQQTDDTAINKRDRFGTTISRLISEFRSNREDVHESLHFETGDDDVNDVNDDVIREEDFWWLEDDIARDGKKEDEEDRLEGFGDHRSNKLLKEDEEDRLEGFGDHRSNVLLKQRAQSFDGNRERENGNDRASESWLNRTIGDGGSVMQQRRRRGRGNIRSRTTTMGEDLEEEMDILDVWRRRRRENELVAARRPRAGQIVRSNSSDKNNDNDDNDKRSTKATTTRAFREGGSTRAHAMRSAQSSFFREEEEEEFVVEETGKVEAKPRLKQKPPIYITTKTKTTKATAPKTKSKNGAVYISAGNLDDDDEFNSSGISEEENDDDFETETRRLDERLDAIKARLKALGVAAL
jgi:hypothetical protein